MFGIVIYLPKDRVAKAAVTLNPDDKVTILLGKSVYVQNCASCHGVKLEGQKDWMSRLPDGLMPAPHMTKQVTLGIIVINIYS